METSWTIEQGPPPVIEHDCTDGDEDGDDGGA